MNRFNVVMTSQLYPSTDIERQLLSEIDADHPSRGLLLQGGDRRVPVGCLVGDEGDRGNNAGAFGTVEAPHPSDPGDLPPEPNQ